MMYMLSISLLALYAILQSTYYFITLKHTHFQFQSLLSPPTTNIQPLPEYKSSVAKKPRWVLSHYGMFKTCWDVLVLLATIYVAIVVPYNAAFIESDNVQMPKSCYNHTGNQSDDVIPETGTSSTSTMMINNNVSDKVDIDPMKSSIYLDVIVEGIFIIGKCHLFSFIL